MNLLGHCPILTMVDSSLIILLLSVPGPKQKKKKEKDELIKTEEEAKTSDTAEEKLVKHTQPPPTIPGRFSTCNVLLRNWHQFACVCPVIDHEL